MRIGEEMIKEFEERLECWINSNEHINDCNAFSEGQLCCLEISGSNHAKLGRKKVIEILRDLLRKDENK